MRLEDVLPAYRAGKQIQFYTKSGERFVLGRDNALNDIALHDQINGEWSIVEEPITITREQLLQAFLKSVPSGRAEHLEALWQELSK